MEFSIPRMKRDENIFGSTLDEVAEVLSWAYMEAQEYLTWEQELADLWFTRIDVVNDIKVGDVGAVLRKVAALGVHNVRQDLISRPRRNGVESLRIWSSRRWTVECYDKGAEVLASARSTSDRHRQRVLNLHYPSAVGVMRTEVQLRKEALGDGGVRMVRDLDESKFYALGKKYRDRVGLSKPLVGNADLGLRLEEFRTGPDKRNFDPVIGYLVGRAYGWSPTCDKATRRHREELALKYGLSPAMFDAEHGQSVRLDYETNRLLTGEDIH